MLPDFARIVMGQSPDSKTYNQSGDGFPFFQGKAEFGELYPTIKTYCSQPKKIAKLGATLLSIRAPVGPTNLAQSECCIGRGLAALHPCGGMESKFLLYLFKSIEPAISKQGTGTTFNSVTKGFIENLEFNLPPLDEQHRIVAKIEELFSELNKGIESLEIAREKLKIYRQVVLKHAFEGKLTARWRERNKDKLEKPDQLLARIKRVREMQYKQLLNEWKAAIKEWESNGKSGKRPMRPKKLKEFSHPSIAEIESLPSLPDNWSYLRLGLVIDEPKYGTSKKCGYDYEGRGVLRIPNVVDGKIDTSDLKGANFKDDEKRLYALRNGDILIVRSNGSISKVGKCARISKMEEQYLYAAYLIRLRSNAALLPDFLRTLLSSHISRAQIERKAKSTSGVNNINSSEIQSLIVPLCNLSEQKEVVERLAASITKLDAIESEIEKQKLGTATIYHSILKKAFSGKLVAQKPYDEPASVFLARIRAAKSAEA